MARIMIAGIGNPCRGDDGAGWAVIDALEERVSGDVCLSKQSGEISQLLDILSGSKTVYLVDACTGTPSGKPWERIDLHLQEIPGNTPQTSTHGLSIPQAVALAGNLEMLPEKLILYAIAGDHYTIAQGLSTGVSHSVACVVEELLKEEDIFACMNSI